VHLIDGHVYVFRAFHSLPPLQAPDGTPTGAAYGFAGMLLRYLAEEAPTHVGVAFDHALTSFRNALEPGYKLGRTEPPEELEPQFALCEELVRALGVAAWSVPDFEADDVIATLATRLASRGARVRVVTSDKDLVQLVREDGRILWHDFARGRTLDAAGVRERFGVAPEQIPDYLGLVGDAVDNLPGVPGVGPRTASALLARFGTIEAIPADPEKWKGLPVRGAARLAERIDAHRERALRSRALATLRRDVPGLSASLSTLRWQGARRDAIEALFERVGWEGIATRIPKWDS
jgi:5'-3' exonuclease